MTENDSNNINPIETDIPHDDSIEGYFKSIQELLNKLPQDINKIADEYLWDVFCIMSEIVKEAAKNKDLKNLSLLADVAMHDILEMLLDNTNLHSKE
ncbi:hypothetical protein KKB18_09420 [bacterium]|nr:hypothetical protein [bacterium]